MNRVALIGDSAVMVELRGLITTVARSDATALITGESGTGKELVARSLHEQSSRSRRPFIPLNCGAIPRDLIESELFGHRKGAFTGALSDRIGRFELAHGGTIFLDEIGDLPLELQVKLLRVLQERVVDPIGSSQPVPIDVRVVAATHRDLELEIAAGRFREDLYYRLNVLPLCSPPLRERGGDVPALLRHYGQHFARDGQTPVAYTGDTLRSLQAYEWPGNVRELCNLVQRFSALYAGRCIDLAETPRSLLPRGLWAQADALREQAALLGCGVDPLQLGLAPPDDDDRSMPAALPSPLDLSLPLGDRLEGVTDALMAVCMAQGADVLPPGGLSLREHIAGIERSLIRQALAHSEGNVSQTAKLLRLQRTTLIEKLQKYELRGLG
jgi:sigma-54 dependent transcriptional regulator, flagellar regulatory protein